LRGRVYYYMTIEYISTGGEIRNEVELKSPPESEKIATLEGKKIVSLLPKIERYISYIERQHYPSNSFEVNNALELMSGLLKKVQGRLEDLKLLSNQEECRMGINNLLADILAEGSELKDIEPKDMVTVRLGEPLKLRDADEESLAGSFKSYLKPFFYFLTSELRKLLA